MNSIKHVNYWKRARYKSFKLNGAILISLSILITSTSITTTYAGKQLAGRATSSPSAGATFTPNTILNGVGAPKSTLGIDGDFYIDTKLMNMYGPKKNGVWPAAVSLKGQAGVDGKNGTTSAGSAGATGAQGPVGPVGPAGPAGAKGEKGDKGETGATGPAGPTGSAGAAGSAGATGATGAKGDTGTATVTVQSVSIPTWTMSGSPTGIHSDSNAFGTLLANKKYRFNISIAGILSDAVSRSRYTATLNCSDASATISYGYTYSINSSYEAVDKKRVSIFFTGVASVTANSNFTISIYDYEGAGDSIS
ncbi:MAG: hypothetical protein RLZZ378_774, partial [Actinomycetota bacterium]